MKVPTDEDVEPVETRWSSIKELAAKNSELVELGRKKNTVTCTIDGKIRHVPFYRCDPVYHRLPPIPEEQVSHHVSLLDALHNAEKCTCPDDAGSLPAPICLRGTTGDVIVASRDHTFIQGGFNFPWKGDVLCRPVGIFGLKELREFGDTFRIGIKDGWIHFEIGPLRFWLRQTKDVCPVFDHHLCRLDQYTWLNIDSRDARFAAKHMDFLQGRNKVPPVWLVMEDGALSVCGYYAEYWESMRLELKRSGNDIDDMSIAVDRRLLRNAFDIGVHRIGIPPSRQVPLVGYGYQSVYYFMPFEDADAHMPEYCIEIRRSDR